MHTWRSWFARLRMRQNSSCFRENVLTYLSTRIFVKSDYGDSSYVKLPKFVILGKIFPSILCKQALSFEVLCLFRHKIQRNSGHFFKIPNWWLDMWLWACSVFFYGEKKVGICSFFSRRKNLCYYVNNYALVNTYHVTNNILFFWKKIYYLL